MEPRRRAGRRTDESKNKTPSIVAPPASRTDSGPSLLHTARNADERTAGGFLLCLRSRPVPGARFELSARGPIDVNRPRRRGDPRRKGKEDTTSRLSRPVALAQIDRRGRSHRARDAVAVCARHRRRGGPAR